MTNDYIRNFSAVCWLSGRDLFERLKSAEGKEVMLMLVPVLLLLRVR